MTTNPTKTSRKLESFLASLDSTDIGVEGDEIMVTTGDLAATQEPCTLPEKDGVDLQATKRIIRRLMKTNLERSASANSDLDLIFAQGSSAIFEYICTLLGLRLDYDAETDGRVTKRTVFNYLIVSVCHGPSSLCSLDQSFEH